MFSVVLCQPQIAPNTGNVIRLCANTGCDLHLIKPLGFDLEEKQLRRAGLDYHEFVNVKTWQNWETFRQSHKRRIVSLSTKNKIRYDNFSYQPNDMLLFGAETHGLPDNVRESINPANRLRIPMQQHSRSLNLANSVAIVVYEAWRQLQFKR